MRFRQHRPSMVKRVDRLGKLAQLFLLLIAGNYCLIQIAQGAHFRELADNNRLREISTEAPRGLIRDRHGQPLVENVPSYSLFIDRSRSENLERSLVYASGILGLPLSDLQEIIDDHRLKPSFKPVLLAERLSLTQVAHFGVEHLEHPEFEIEVKHLRLYRHAHQTAHVLGYLGEATDADLARMGSTYRSGDQIGKKGIEGHYEEYLRGERGEQVVVVDSRGRLIDELDSFAASPGQDLTLTLDLELQQVAAQQLEGRVGAIVALDPRQGEVLAMVSAPSFNPNRFARRLRREEWLELIQNPEHPLQNRCLQNAYPPGSVFKIVMALAGLDHSVVDPETTTVHCRGFSNIYNNRYRCWKPGGHGTVNLRRSLKHSCNVYYHQLGQRLDIDKIADYARKFGLGRLTQIDLDGEKAGLIPDSPWSLKARGNPWYPGETISVATGQGPILVTPLQVAVMLSAVANGGRLVKPHLVRGGPENESIADQEHLQLLPENLKLIREALWSVVNEPRGTGNAAGIVGLNIAGKTGTAQVISQESRTDNENLPQEHRDHAWFASFAPHDDPQLVVVVFVEHGGAGSKAAAPLAKALYETFFRTRIAQQPAA